MSRESVRYYRGTGGEPSRCASRAQEPWIISGVAGVSGAAGHPGVPGVHSYSLPPPQGASGGGAFSFINF